MSNLSVYEVYEEKIINYIKRETICFKPFYYGNMNVTGFSVSLDLLSSEIKRDHVLELYVTKHRRRLYQLDFIMFLTVILWFSNISLTL